MNKYRALLGAAGVALCFSGISARPGDISDIVNRLSAVDEYADSCTYEVLLASLSEPVTYGIGLQSRQVNQNDTLSPCRYIISWTLPTPSGISEGFSAYFDGSHFRYRDKRLQEYHAEVDPGPFMPGGNIDRGVQNQVQFADLLPQFIGEHFREMKNDSTFIYTVTNDTIVDGLMSTVVKGVRRIAGYDGLEYTYILDNTSLLPRRIELENNPGQIGEQSIAVTYSCSKESPDTEIDLQSLMLRYGEAFEKYRESSFSLDNLPGRPLPEISAPMLSGERYYHHRGSKFDAPTILAFVDTSVGSTPEVISQIRSALALTPRHVEVIWAFIDHRTEDVEASIGSVNPGETVVIHAGGGARDCGVGSITPVIIFANTDGTVSDFTRGFNQDLESLVIQKVNLCN